MMILELPINEMIDRLEAATQQLDDVTEIKKNLSITKTLREIIELEKKQNRAARYNKR